RLPIGAVADLQVHLARLHQKGFVLAVVVLAREALPGSDVEDLPHVAWCLGPDELVAPGLLHAAHRVVLCRPGAAVKARRPRESRTRRGLRTPSGGLPASRACLLQIQPAERAA